jgi:hypothetical protein
VSNNHDGQQQTPADADGRSLPVQACRSPGSPHRDLASRRRGREFKTSHPDHKTAGYWLFSDLRLISPLPMSDFGSQMGAALDQRACPEGVGGMPIVDIADIDAAITKARAFVMALDQVTLLGNKPASMITPVRRKSTRTTRSKSSCR